MYKFILHYADVIDEYDLNEYVCFKYSFDDDPRMLEVNINVISGTSLIYNFINMIHKLYKIDNYSVIFKNYKYNYWNGNISQIKMY